MTSETTTMVGPYRIDGLIGRGGMGEVFKAFDTRRQRTVALKLLPESLSHDQDYRERFRRESLAAASLVSPHVVPIHDFGEVEGRLFIDMRLIEGADLATRLAGHPMSVERAVNIVLQVCDALTDAHARGVVHRDVKPSNILLTDSDFAYLVDFGIATTSTADTPLTATGYTVGTFGYMAPERFDGSTADPRSDIYSLGCVLHELLTGRRPFAEHNSTPSLIRAHLMLDPTAPSAVGVAVPAELDQITLRAMAKSPEQRFASSVDLADALRASPGVPAGLRRPSGAITSFAHDAVAPLQRAIPTQLGADLAPAPDTAPTKTSTPRFRPRRAAVAIALAALLGLAAAVGLIWTSSSPPSPSTGGGRPQVSDQPVGQSSALPANMQGRWYAHTQVGFMEVTLDGGGVDEQIGTATTNPRSPTGPAPAPCAYSIDLVSALTGTDRDQAVIRLAVAEDEQRRECPGAMTMNLEQRSNDYILVQPGGELCYQACKPAEVTTILSTA